MLVLSRKKGEVINIGKDVIVKVIKVGPNSVKLGFDAPRGTSILRKEIIRQESGGKEGPQGGGSATDGGGTEAE